MAAAQPDLSVEFQTKYLEGWNTIVTSPYSVNKKIDIATLYNKAVKVLYNVFKQFPEGEILEESEFINYNTEFNELADALSQAFEYYRQNRREHGETVRVLNLPIMYLTDMKYELREVFFEFSRNLTKFRRNPGFLPNGIDSILKNPHELTQQGGKSRKRKTRRVLRKRKSKSRRRV
jgi:hypothetical protein